MAHSMPNIKKEAKKRAREKWSQLCKELADSSMVTLRRIDLAISRMRERARDLGSITEATILRRAADVLRDEYRQHCV